jgi:uncharacterized membrane protein
MHVAYIVVTILAALANGYAASMNFIGAESVKVVADQVQVSQRWMVPFGALLASGALGLLIGLAVPALGMAAAIGLVAYFVCALGAHIRAHNRNVGGAVTFLMLALGALIVDLGYHHWLRRPGWDQSSAGASQLIWPAMPSTSPPRPKRGQVPGSTSFGG